MNPLINNQDYIKIDKELLAAVRSTADKDIILYPPDFNDLEELCEYIESKGGDCDTLDNFILLRPTQNTQIIIIDSMLLVVKRKASTL